jgi:hypothetical protein
MVMSFKGDAERVMDAVQGLAWELFARDLVFTDQPGTKELTARIERCLKLATEFTEQHQKFKDTYVEAANERRLIKVKKDGET